MKNRPGCFPCRQNFWLDRSECKWNAWFDRKFFGTNGRPSEVFHFFRSSWLGPRNSGSICAILFRPAAGTWTFFRLFQCLAVSFDHGLSQFFFSFPVVSFKMASVQNSCELCPGSNFLKRNSNKLPLFPLLARKPFHLTWKVSGISNRKFSLNGKRLGHHLEAWGYKLQWFLKLSTLAPKPGPRFIV